MFTGIVQSKAQVLFTEIKNGIRHLTIKVETELSQQLTLGASIAINGVCLTVVSVAPLDENYSEINFDIIDETLRVTNLNRIKTGDYVNFERSLKVGDEIGGHQVSGHIHTMASVIKIEENQDNVAIKFCLLGEGRKYIFEKGFISINGTSLTLGKVIEDEFAVHLIPETLERTNIGDLVQGSEVNIEFDQQTITIVDTIERMNLKLANA